MARRSALIAAALAVVALTPDAVAHAQTTQLRVAIYAPWSGPKTADERHAFALKIQDAIKGAGLGAATVSNYAKVRDFKRALAGANVDVVLVDSGAASSLGKKMEVVASWSSGDRWVLAADGERSSLRNQRLALQAHDAPSSVRVVGMLLRRRVSASYWSSIVGAPVTEDARQLVVRGKADVVVVPKRAASGLTEIADIGSFSELAIATPARRNKELTPVRKVVQATVRARLGGIWSDGKPSFPERVDPTALVAAPVSGAEPTMLDLLAAAPASLPELVTNDSDLWIEPNAP